MRRFVSRPGFAAIVLGALIVAHLAVAGLLFTADRDFVYFGSKPLPAMCSFRKTFGIPCPTCGITRGVVLSLHGKLTDAMATNAAAPVLVGAALSLGLCVLGMGVLQSAERRKAAERLADWTRRIGVTAAGTWFFVLVCNWIVELKMARV
jgi:hypothetical protein